MADDDALYFFTSPLCSRKSGKLQCCYSRNPFPCRMQASPSYAVEQLSQVNDTR